MTLALNMQSACKIMVASGISKSDTSTILNTLEREQTGSGSKFLLDRMKALKQFCEDKIVGKEPSLPWFRKTKAGFPKDPGWRKLIEEDPRKGLQNLSVLIMDMKHIPDQDTKDTIYDNIYRDDPISPEITDRFAAPNKALIKAFTKAHYVAYRRYAPDTLQGVSFPLYEGKSYRVKTDRDGNKDKEQLLDAYYEGLCSAPESLADYYLKKAEIARSNAFIEKVKNGCTNQKWFLPPKIQELESYGLYYDTIQDIIRVEAFDNNSNLEETYGGDLSMVEIPMIVGSISVIPSPGMKDRVIANPNPAVQSALYNLGEYLGNVTKNLEPCYVFDQEAGIRKIQDYLSLGIELASIDMSAATDRLSADAGWSLISNCISASSKDAGMKENLQADLDFFKEVSRSAFYIGNLGEDGIEYVSYTQGQPMGLKPSFPMLTLMNVKAGLDAQAAVPGSVSPVVVGDDIVIDYRCLPHYLETIQGLGGKINLEKTMQSANFAKFCSRLISPTEVIREKPRYVYGDRMQNALELRNLSLLKPWERDVAIAAASQSIDDLDGINIKVDKAPLINRITDRAVQRLTDTGQISEMYRVHPEIAKLSLSLREEDQTSYHKEIVSKRFDRYRYETGQELSDHYDSLEFVDHLSEVKLPLTETSYDHHNDSRVKKHKSGDVYRVKKIAKSSKSEEVSQASFDHHKGEILYDNDTALFQPKGSKTVLDISEQVNSEKDHIVSKLETRPLSNKRKPIQSDAEYWLSRWNATHPDYSEPEGKDDDEYSL